MSGQRILVVDDEPQILRALETNLRGAGYEVETAATSQDALARAAARPPDAIVLDLVLPDGSGTDVCRELRRWSPAPIVILSVVGEEREKVAALDAGADDYVTKPFGMDELLARLRAALRRTVPTGEPVLRIGELVVDLAGRSVRVGGRPVALTPTEFELLALFARHEGKLLTHPTILREVWGPGLRHGVALPPCLRLPASPQDRARSGPAAVSADRARRRLPPGRPLEQILSLGAVFLTRR